jgi:hypothetical protein
MIQRIIDHSYVENINGAFSLHTQRHLEMERDPGLLELNGWKYSDVHVKLLPKSGYSLYASDAM